MKTLVRMLEESQKKNDQQNQEIAELRMQVRDLLTIDKVQTWSNQP